MIITRAVYSGSSDKISNKPGTLLPEFAFIGRSNVGKSSLINCLCDNNKLAHTSSTPGKTQCINHFTINDSWYIVDLPGYGYAKTSKKLRERLNSIIFEYILKSEELTLLFVLLDSRHDIQKNDLEFLLKLGEEGIPFALVFTKCDKMGKNALAEQINRNREELLKYWEELPPVFLSSSASGAGRNEILEYIDSILKSLNINK